MWPHAKEGGREGYGERVNERPGREKRWRVRKIHPIGEGLG